MVSDDSRAARIVEDDEFFAPVSTVKAALSDQVQRKRASESLRLVPILLRCVGVSPVHVCYVACDRSGTFLYSREHKARRQ